MTSRRCLREKAALLDAKRVSRCPENRPNHTAARVRLVLRQKKRRRWESNPRMADLQSAALATWLRRRASMVRAIAAAIAPRPLQLRQYLSVGQALAVDLFSLPRTQRKDGKNRKHPQVAAHPKLHKITHGEPSILSGLGQALRCPSAQPSRDSVAREATRQHFSPIE